MRVELGSTCRIWEQGPTNRPGKPCLRPGRFGRQVDFKDYEHAGARLFVPAYHLFGTQTMGEYEAAKRRSAESKLATCGIDCLKEHPIPVCALPSDNGLTLAIIDGHHRTRYAGNSGIHTIPCIIYTPPQLVDIFNQHGLYNRLIDKTFLVADLNRAVGETLSSFGGSLPEHKQPKTIPVSSIDGLKRMLKPF